MVLPLVFSYSATILRKEASSSRRKPWSQYTVAVLAAALAMNGRPSVPAAASPTDPRRTERLLSSITLIPFDLLLGRRNRGHDGDPGNSGAGEALPPHYAG